MATSLITKIKESLRQARTGDDSYMKKGFWVFRVVCANGAFVHGLGPKGTASFPLPVNPEHFDYNLPFARQLTPQQEGGVVAERAGFVLGEITLNGTTGFALRKNKATDVGAHMGPFTAAIGTATASPNDDISGQMAWWVLANKCFESYSELCKDPKYSATTQMELHISKEDLHLEVEPRTLRLTRDAGRERVTYRYQIVLDVVGAAQPIDYSYLQERSLWDQITDTISEVRDAVQSVGAALQDITASIDAVRRQISSITNLVSDLQGIVDAGNNLVTGVTSYFKLPSQVLGNTIGLVESVSALADTIDAIPMEFRAALHDIQDQVERLKVATQSHLLPEPSDLAQEWNEGNINSRQWSELQGSDLQAAIEAAATAGATAGGTMSIDDAFGVNGQPQPGDLARQSLTQPAADINPANMAGFMSVAVTRYDTIQSLAGKYLGDARRWKEIALVNQLRPPYISCDVRLPGTVGEGGIVLVPTVIGGQQAAVTPDGTTPVANLADARLGVDNLLVQVGRTGLFGWRIDTAHGATDVLRSRGVDNLGQGLETRLRTEHGHDLLFPNVGMPRTVGDVADDQQSFDSVRYQVRQQILADPRVQQLVGFSLLEQEDVLTLEADIVPVGYSSTRPIRRTIS
jgi:hypothetical protein